MIQGYYEDVETLVEFKNYCFFIIIVIGTIDFEIDSNSSQQQANSSKWEHYTTSILNSSVFFQ
jgi:hypothetical protein